MKGRLVTGKGDYSGKSIFLPAAGYGYGSNLSNPGSNGYYWSSSPNSDYSYYAWYLYFSSSNFYWLNYYRCYGRSVGLSVPCDDLPNSARIARVKAEPRSGR